MPFMLMCALRAVLLVRSLRLYNALVERCFKDCVDDFRSKNLAKDEEKVTRRAECRQAGSCMQQHAHAAVDSSRKHVQACSSRPRARAVTPRPPAAPPHRRRLALLQCVHKCCEKFMNVSARTGLRFQEFFTEMEKQAAEAAKQAARRR